MARCEATNAKGEPCGAPESMVDPQTQRCPSHAEGAHERLSLYGQRGAQATKRKWAGGGMDPNDLPPLRTPQDAERWLERIGRAVATGHLTNGAGQTAVRAVTAWLTAHQAGAVSTELAKLGEQVAALRDGGKLKAVK